MASQSTAKPVVATDIKKTDEKTHDVNVDLKKVKKVSCNEISLHYPL